MRKLIVLGLLAGLALAALFAIPAGARPPGVNGQIVFGRFDPTVFATFIYTVNPDGSHERQVLPNSLECPHWSADGSRIVTCGFSDGSSTVIINPDTGSFREVFSSDPTLFLACPLPSPDGQRLACGQFDQPVDPSRNGIYSIRSSDGGGLLRITSNPGAGEFQDLPIDGEPLWSRVARRAAEWGPGGTVGLVVGATAPAELRAVRSVAPGVGFLVPGLGAQGGSLDAVLEAGPATLPPAGGRVGRGLLVNVSRGIAGAPAEHAGGDPGEAIAAAARDWAARLPVLP